MRLAQLKRLVMVESVAPLLITSILSCGIGVLDGGGIHEDVLDDTEAGVNTNLLYGCWCWSGGGHHWYILDFADGRQADAGGG